MKVRTGSYTIYNNVELEIYSLREQMDFPLEEQKFSACYELSTGLRFPDFFYSQGLMCKHVHFSELSNVFFIKTFGLYNGLVVQLFTYYAKPEKVCISLKDEIAAERYGFLKLSTGYEKMVESKELEKVWEERSRNDNFPGLSFPEGLERYKEIKL